VAALLSAADVACYSAKGQGRNRIQVYEGGEASSGIAR
jgi:PleD family two-component response regulator